jgi:alkylation response protein AidB-like acyl-CoA dehydrogenase
MTIADLDFDLTDTELSVRETARRFAMDVLRPAGIDMDKMTAEAAISKDSPYWGVFEKYNELGFNTVDPDMAPLDQARLNVIVSEELSKGDVGLALSLGVAGFPNMAAKATGNPEVIEKFQVGQLGCWAITEPDHGSDMVDFDELAVGENGKRPRPNCIAKADGNEYVISGQKSAWVSNGSIAETAALYCAVETHEGNTGGGVFVVPLDGPNVTRGKPLEKLGQRPLNQGEIFFDQVRIPADNMVAGPENYSFMTSMTLVTANCLMGVSFAGVAMAAFEMALEYAKERVQGGVPIIQHQSVKARLFEMYRQVEVARSMARRAYYYNMASGKVDLSVAITSKVTCTQAAFDVASDAIQIFGGNGISREYPIEKLFRDARLSMIEDGCNEVLGLVGGDLIAA